MKNRTTRMKSCLLKFCTTMLQNSRQISHLVTCDLIQGLLMLKISSCAYFNIYLLKDSKSYLNLCWHKLILSSCNLILRVSCYDLVTFTNFRNGYQYCGNKILKISDDQFYTQYPKLILKLSSFIKQFMLIFSI